MESDNPLSGLFQITIGRMKCCTRVSAAIGTCPLDRQKRPSLMATNAGPAS